MSAHPPATQPGSPTSAGLIADAPVRRRAFFGWFGVGGTMAALATSLPAATAGALAQRILNRSQLMLNEVTQAEFAACTGDSFQLELAPGQAVPALLGEATLLKNSHGQNPQRRAPFSILFRVPSETMLPQRIYALEHPQLGRLEIFLVPIGREDGHLLLEAIFN